MPANAAFQGIGNIDGITERLVPFFDTANGGLTFPYATCKELLLNKGSTPSLAVCSVPLLGVDEKAGQVAFTDNVKALKGSRCTVKRFTGNGLSNDVFVGTIRDAIHSKENESEGLVIQAVSDVFLLQGIYIIGRYQIHDINKTSDGGFPFTYLQGKRAIFNEGGLPNKIMSVDSFPVFCEPEFGLVDGDQPEKLGDSRNKASYWTLGDMIQYLQTFYGTTDFQNMTSAWPWMKLNYIDKTKIDWNENFGSNIDADSVAQFNQAGAQGNASKGQGRKGRQIDLEGVNIADALDLILGAAGGWSWSMRLSANGKSEMFCLPTRYTGNGVTLSKASSGRAQDVLAGAIVTGGVYSESIANWASHSVVAGDNAYIENRLDTFHTTVQFEKAWTTEAEVAARKYLKAFPAAQGLTEAWINYRDVYALYQINKNYDFQDGTLYETFPRAKLSRAIAYALKSFRGGTDGSVDYKVSQYPITFESSDDGIHWVTLDLNDGLEVYDNGTFRIPGLRDNYPNPETWKWTSTPFMDLDGDGQVDITERYIRATVAIPCDHRVTACASLNIAGINNVGAQTDIINTVINDSPDIDKIDPSFTRLHYIDAGNLYKMDLRKGAFGVPQSAQGTQLDDKVGGIDINGSLNFTVRSDAAQQLAHARKDLLDKGKLDKSGSYFRLDGYLLPEFSVGTQIEALVDLGDGSKFNVRGVVGQCAMNADGNNVFTQLQLI